VLFSAGSSENRCAMKRFAREQCTWPSDRRWWLVRARAVRDSGHADAVGIGSHGSVHRVTGPKPGTCCHLRLVRNKYANWFLRIWRASRCRRQTPVLDARRIHARFTHRGCCRTNRTATRGCSRKRIWRQDADPGIGVVHQRPARKASAR
jgi:hypothetical protein